jgi:predicted nuclease of predicted toxin-antitoxin system
MKILVDEHVPLMTVAALREAGHDVRDIRGTKNEGMDDVSLWKLTQRESRLLITTDAGFVQYRSTLHHGLLIVRLKQPNRLRIHERIMQALRQVPEKKWPGLLMVMRDIAQSAWSARKQK